jgi:hypothetical protein
MGLYIIALVLALIAGSILLLVIAPGLGFVGAVLAGIAAIVAVVWLVLGMLAADDELESDRDRRRVR